MVKNRTENQIKNPSFKRYGLTFLITGFIFFLGFSLSQYVSNLKLSKLQDLRQSLQVDILDLETQFSLLEKASCSSTNEVIAAKKLQEVGKKLEYLETNLEKREEIKTLKKYYSLLQIRHWLFSKKLVAECKWQRVPILYFYSKDCKDCKKQGYILSYLRNKYERLRVYSFDANLDLPSLQIVKSFYPPKKLPTLVIEEDVFYGFQTKKELEKIIKAKISSKDQSLQTDSLKSQHDLTN